MGYRCLATEVPDAIERLLRQYLRRASADENLRQFFARHTDTELREFLAGQPVEAVARDLPPVRSWTWTTAQPQEATVTNLFPMFMKLAGKQCLVVGAGKVGEPKIGGLIDTGAQHPRGCD